MPDDEALERDGGQPAAAALVQLAAVDVVIS